jgi:agmatinase
MSERFLGVGAPSETSEAVILGAGLATVYPGREPHATGGPAAIRAASCRLAHFAGNHDFDTGRPFASWRRRIADGGDVSTARADAEGNRRRITAAVHEVLVGGAMPVLFGGDDSVAAPFVAAWRDHGPLTIVHVDAHLDFRDEVDGERHGYSSSMRRACEMGWVRRILHIGQRGVGSARASDVQDSLAAGNTIVSARELARVGVAAAAAQLAVDEEYVLVYDVDGTDPADIPAVRAPAPGGPRAAVVADLFAALAARGRLQGLVVAELEPLLDPNGSSAMVLARLVCQALDGRLAEA